MRELVLPDGRIKVREGEGLIRARGLSYATAARFQPPVPVPPWSGVREALQPGPLSPQDEVALQGFSSKPCPGAGYREDCLHVAVTAPVPDGRKRPVLVWIHGGGFTGGGADTPNHDPADLVREGDVIVVSINYRLGVLGFLGIPAVSPANLGLLDQIAGLRWVQRNISGFGGDAGNVTVFGESAGAYAITDLMVADGADGLFRRAIVQSPPLGLKSRRAAMTKAFAAGILAHVRHPATASLKELLAAQSHVSTTLIRFGLKSGMALAPEVGHPPLPSQTEMGRRLRAVAPKIDVIIGYTIHEGALFIRENIAVNRISELPRFGDRAYEVIRDHVTRRAFSAAIRRFASQYAAAGGRIALYRFDWDKAPYGACHAIDIPFLLGNPESWRVIDWLDGVDWKDIGARGRSVRKIWTAFARDGSIRDDPSHTLRWLVRPEG